MNNKIFPLLFAISALLSVNDCWAKGNVVAGQQKSQVCQACHGSDGIGTDPSYPNLAGQHASYLSRSLQDYRSGARSNPVMASFAKTLADQDIADLAAFYASKKGLEDIQIK